MAKIVSTGRTISTTEYLNKKMKAQRKRYSIIAVVILILLVGAIFALRLKNFQVSAVTVSGAMVTGEAPVEMITRDLFSGNYLWLVPRASAVFYPRATIERKLLEKFPRFSSVVVSLEGLQTLSVLVAERAPFATYCQKDSCYFLDETGFIFDVSPNFSDGVYFTYSSDESFAEPLGKQFLPIEGFKELSGFVVRLKKLGVGPLSIHLSSSDVEVFLKSGAKIVFSRTGSPDRIFSSLESFMTSSAVVGEKDFWEKLKSLDLRTENKVFYTFRE